MRTIYKTVGKTTLRALGIARLLDHSLHIAIIDRSGRLAANLEAMNSALNSSVVWLQRFSVKGATGTRESPTHFPSFRSRSSSHF
jgi:hypothetical protein